MSSALLKSLHPAQVPSSVDSLVSTRGWAHITVLVFNWVKESINHEMWIHWKQDSFIWELTKLLVPSPFHSLCLFSKLFQCQVIKFTFKCARWGDGVGRKASSADLQKWWGILGVHSEIKCERPNFQKVEMPSIFSHLGCFNLFHVGCWKKIIIRHL